MLESVVRPLLDADMRNVLARGTMSVRSISMIHITDENGTVLGTVNTQFPKQFKTGSTGYNFNGKWIDGKGNKFQVNMNITLIGSKDRGVTLIQ